MTATRYTLYYYKGFASLAVHLALAELDLSYDLVNVDIPDGENRERGYLAINPLGQVPALVETTDGRKGKPMTQTVAILETLAVDHPGRGLIPDDPDQRRAARIWLSYLNSGLQPTFRRFFHPEDFVDIPAHEADVRQTAERRLGEMFDWIEMDVNRGGPFLAGDQPSAPDYLFYTLCHWGRHLSQTPAERPAINALLERMTIRPGVQKALKAEGLL